MIEERLLERMQMVAICQTLDSVNLGAIRLHGQNQAGIDKLVIEKNTACAASPARAGLFGASQLQLLPQHMQQSVVRGNRQLMGIAVHDERNRVVHFVPRHNCATTVSTPRRISTGIIARR